MKGLIRRLDISKGGRQKRKRYMVMCYSQSFTMVSLKSSRRLMGWRWESSGVVLVLSGRLMRKIGILGPSIQAA